MELSSESTPTYRIFRDKHGIPQFSPKRSTRELKNALAYAFPALETELQLMQAALQKFFDAEKRGSGTFICELPENNLQASLAVRKEDEIPPLPTADAFLKNWKVALMPQRMGRGSGSSRGRTPSLTSRGTSRATSRSRTSSRCSTPSLYQEPAFEIFTGGTMSTWNLSNGEAIEKKKRTPYDPVKRRKVAENRGNACEKHRAQKSTCDPSKCPQNKLYAKTLCRQNEGTDSKVSQASEMGTESPFVDSSISDSSLPIPNDVLWLGSNDNSFLDLHHSITTSSSGSWADSSYSNEVSQSTYDLQTSGNTLSPSDVPAEMPHSFEFTSIDTTAPHLGPSLGFGFEHPIEESMWPNFDPTEQNLGNGDDPFMGWGDKRESQTTEEYGWVLSHVEQL